MLAPVASTFSPLYLSYLEWLRDPDPYPREIRELRGLVIRVAAAKGTTLHWLVDWADVDPALSPVTLADFWGAARLTGSDKVEVSPAYTKAGRQKIDAFLTQYASSLDGEQPIAERIKEFDAWYWKEFVHSWELFGQNFDQGSLRLSTLDDRRDIGEMMADTNNPYFALLDRMNAELSIVKDKSDIPDWVDDVFDYAQIRDNAAHPSVLKKKQELASKAEAGAGVLSKVIGKTEESDLAETEAMLGAAEKLTDYEEALVAILPATGSSRQALKMAAEFYQGSDDQNKSPFHDAQIALNGIKNAVSKSKAVKNELFFRLLSGPYYYLMAYTIQEAACELETQWQGQVLFETQETPDDKLAETLFAKDNGLVWKFVQGPAAPFLTKGAGGHVARTQMEHEFPFRPAFLTFLDLGSAQIQVRLPKYEVLLDARPTTVNRDALLEPYATHLTVSCDKAPQELENYNYPAQAKIEWTPDECRETILEVRFPDFTLTRTYPGTDGFAEFCEDFRGGSRTFTPDDFPDQKEDLEALRVKTVRVTYAIQGATGIRKLLSKETFTLPQSIVECWGK